ncbi:LuxR C-terminal-related transcriptional regulator [Streptomyces griseoluteus]|uniref:LuxR C-terminal-related transcriptional regulator n=1 Tax=Streptomyces griseoluteus TaxID=29306 RepID=UPI003676C1DE
MVVTTAITLAVVAWGALRQKQQDLVALYRDRAARIEREREQRAEQIQMAERARIAWDMHDSVAHYISLIALYAGRLAVAGDNARNVGTTAATIRTTTISALDELRTVIGILRDGTVVTPRNSEHEHTVAGLIDEARQGPGGGALGRGVDADHLPPGHTRPRRIAGRRERIPAQRCRAARALPRGSPRRRGGIRVSATITRQLVARHTRTANDSAGAKARRTWEALTDRERAVAEAVAEGASHATIAKALFMSEATVKTHISRALTKTGLDNRVQLALMVFQAQRNSS